MVDVKAIPDGPLLGVSADFHDSAAALLVDGVIVAAAQEERFSRIKHDPSLPIEAISWCLEDAGVDSGDLAAVVFHEKPFTTYERILASHATVGPRGFPVLKQTVGTWTRSKLWAGARLQRALAATGRVRPRVLYAEHHMSHAAAAFYPSPHDEAAVLTVDGVGEWATTTIAHGSGADLRIVEELRFPDSVGLLYSAATAYLGFEVNDGEYKVMGLAPYGEPRFLDELLDSVVHLSDDGSVGIDQRFFDYRVGRCMTTACLDELLEGPARAEGEALDQRHADVAASVQRVVEEAMLGLARRARSTTKSPYLCMAGGVALNCVANRRMIDAGIFDDVWVQPAAGDAGSALGAAMWAAHAVRGDPRGAPTHDGMAGATLGPRFDAGEIARWLERNQVPFKRVPDPELRNVEVARELADGAVVGWFEGRMEFGPRALGHRSILADPRRRGVVTDINSRVKGRESFRPFAPAVLQEHAEELFDLAAPSPFMLFTAPVRGADLDRSSAGSFADRLATVRSPLPACTHVDGSARVQTVDRERHPAFHSLLRAFEAATGCPVLLNTSFNRAGEPIVRSPADALRTAETTGLDLLVLEDCLVRPGAREFSGPPPIRSTGWG